MEKVIERSKFEMYLKNVYDPEKLFFILYNCPSSLQPLVKERIKEVLK